MVVVYMSIAAATAGKLKYKVITRAVYSQLGLTCKTTPLDMVVGMSQNTTRPA